MRSAGRLLLSIALLHLVLGSCGCTKRSLLDMSEQERAQFFGLSAADSKLRGWDYLAIRLAENGIAKRQIEEVFGDPRMPLLTPIPFSLEPRESPRIYQPFLRPASIKLARQFIEKHYEELKEAQKSLGVDKTVVTAILLIETGFGQYIGNHRIIERLARVASVAQPANVEFNYQRLKAQDPKVTKEKVQKRADYLEQLFLPEVVALFEVAKRKEVDLFELRGSSAGAFGIPQFLPSSFLRFAIDGNNDGTVSLFDPLDAIWSAANYLKQNGWKERLTLKEKRAVIRKYNNSEPYVDAVLAVAARLK